MIKNILIYIFYVLMIKVLNFTHRFYTFSFGQYYPGLINPLDNTAEITEKRMNLYFKKSVY